MPAPDWVQKMVTEKTNNCVWREKSIRLEIKTFIQADEEKVISGFSALGVSAIPSRETMTLIEKCLCQLSI